MKNSFKLIALVSVFLTCFFSPLFAQTASDEVELPRHIDRKYRRDAARLTLRLEGQIEDYRYLGVDTSF